MSAKIPYKHTPDLRDHNEDEWQKTYTERTGLTPEQRKQMLDAAIAASNVRWGGAHVGSPTY